MLDVPINTNTLSSPTVGELKFLTEDEFATKAEALIYYRLQFLRIVFFHIPEVLESLESIYTEFERLVERELNKKKLTGYMVCADDDEDNQLYVPSEDSRGVSYLFLQALSSGEYLKVALPDWAKKYRIPLCNKWYEPIYMRVVAIIGAWYARSHNVDPYFEDFLETRHFDGTPEVEESMRLRKAIPRELEVFSFEWDYSKDWLHLPVRKKDIEEHLRRVFENRLSQWLEAREKSGYFESMTSKKQRLDKRWENFKYLAHHMVLRKSGKDIAKEFGLFKDEDKYEKKKEATRRVEEGITKACKILEFDREPLKLRPGRKKKMG